MSDPKPKQEHPLANILINVIIPVLVLSFLSKDPDLQEKLGKAVRPWHIGPIYAMIVALALPLGYGIWHFIQTRKPNFFSGLGLISIALTGGLTLYLWNPDGSVKPNAGLLFGIKDGWRRRGIDALLAAETFTQALALGYQAGELGWAMEDDTLVNRMLQATGAKHVKTFRVYERPL